MTASETRLNKTGYFAVCGNPNCGKTTIFNHITGLSQQVGNYPGVTVERVIGQFSFESNKSQKYSLIDIPGTYSLSAFTPDEYIAASALFGDIEGDVPPDVIIAVLDATNLERSLYLLLQIMQTGCPIVVGLNMIDLAEKRGIRIDSEKLSKALGGIPVVPVIGNKGTGVNELKECAVSLLNKGIKEPEKLFSFETEKTLTSFIQSYPKSFLSRAHALRIIFDSDGPAEKKFILEEGGEAKEFLYERRKRIISEHEYLSYAETNALTVRAENICQHAVLKENETSKSRSEKIDKILLHPVIGPIILAALMLFVFQSIFSWAEPFMTLIDSTFGSIAGMVENNMTEGPLCSLITDGIIGGVGSVLIFLPQIILLFISISLLEDSGYMPRAAFIVDRMFRWCGLSGKSFIPMLSSFACAVPGIMATRTIEDRRLRLMTIMVAPLMTCSARLPVYAIMIAAFIPYKTYFGIVNLQGLTLALLYLLGIVAAISVSFILQKTVYKTERGTFLMELPSYKTPMVKSVFIRVFIRAKQFVIRAGTVIMAITIIIWALSYYPRYESPAGSIEEQQANLEQLITLNHKSVISEIEEVSRGLDSIKILKIRGFKEKLDLVSNEESLEEMTIYLNDNNADYADIIELYTDYHRFRFSTLDKIDRLANELAGAQIRNSYLGIFGQAVEPAFKPLGWDWKITMSVLASFPAREVIIAVLGTIYNLGTDVDQESSSLIDKMREAKWEDGDKIGQPVFTVAVAVSIMIFFALCCQCGATLVTIKQETTKWIYPIVVFTYMTLLAYMLAFVSYQLLSSLGL